MKLTIFGNIISLFFSIFLFASFHVKAEQDEYFGEFTGEPSLKVKNNDEGRPTFVLLEDFSFKDPNGFLWTTPKKWEVDGASIPQFVWSLFGGPMSGKYIYASIIHDRYCDTRERTAHDTHRNFYYGMKASGVSEGKANSMYWAVRTFGPSWKLVKKRTVIHGTAPNSNAYHLADVDVSALEISNEIRDKLAKQISPEMSLSEMDSLSDAIRKEYGSEALQKVPPTLSNSGSDNRRTSERI